jgi:hypothetical protein
LLPIRQSALHGCVVCLRSECNTYGDGIEKTGWGQNAAS